MYSSPPWKLVSRKHSVPESDSEEASSEGSGSAPPSSGKTLETRKNPRKSKRARKEALVAVASADNEGRKRELFERLWSEDDEIELIQGMIKYVAEKGKEAMEDVNDLYEFVRKSLTVDVNKKQMRAKIKRIKEKFKKNEGIIKKEGRVRSFSKGHERKMYELSKELWGRKKKNAQVEVQLDFPITDDGIMKKGLELLSGPKKAEMKEKLKNLKLQEFEHHMKMVEFMKNQTELVLNATRKSGAS